MLNLLKQIDALQVQIDKHRPNGRQELASLKQYYKVGLAFSSNALEGNSLTELETKVILEDRLAIGGKTLNEHLEAIGHSQAFDYMWNVSKHQAITERNIKYLHKLFLQGIDAKNAGKYRKQQVVISSSQYNDTLPAPAAVSLAMQAFVTALPSKRLELHPVAFAAFLHKTLVFIHPFIDGNGRVARLLMNLSLLQAGFPITSISPILRSEYIRLLEKAHLDDGDFTKFIAEQVLQSQQKYIRLLRI